MLKSDTFPNFNYSIITTNIGETILLNGVRTTSEIGTPNMYLWAYSTKLVVWLVNKELRSE